MSNVMLSDESDFPLLLFLWKWKVSTTAALSQKFYGTRQPFRAYKRLWLLEKADFIQSRYDVRRQKSVWMLTKKGFRTIRNYLPELSAEGYLSEHIGHDLLTAAVHLGEWFHETPPGVEFFSEQELRRIDPSHFPPWVPRMVHRPDGYWRVLSSFGPKTIALEVELNAKKDSDYGHTGRVYELHRLVHAVLWVTATNALASKIQGSIQKATHEAQPHNFITTEEFTSCGWQSVIRSGQDAGKTVAELLGKSTGTGEKALSVAPLLNLRKAPHCSRASAPYAIGDFPN